MSYIVVRRLCAVAALFAGMWLPSAYAQEHDHAAPPQGLLGADGTIELAEVLERVEAANPDLRTARLEAEALGFVPDQVSSWPDPTVSVAYQPYPLLTARGSQRSQWSVEQRIPYPGKTSLRGEIASLHAREAGYRSDALLEELRLEAKVAFFELYRLGELELLIARFEQDLQSFEESAAVRYEVGRGPQQALLRAQLDKNQLSQRLHHLEGARRKAAETLARLTNDPEGPRAFLTAAPRLPDRLDLNAAVLAQIARDRRPEWAALAAAAERAEAQVALARKEAYPDVAMRISYFDIAEGDVPPTASGRDAVALGAAVSIPLQRNRIRARIQEAQTRRDQIIARQEALRTEYRTRIEELLAELDHESRSIEEYETVLLPQAMTLSEATTNAYSTGMADYQEILEVERTLFALRSGHLDAVTRYLKTAAHLERVLGVRSLEDVTPTTASFQALPSKTTRTHE